MRSFIFTKRDREVLEAELAGILDQENAKDTMLLAVLKNRIKDYRTNLLKDVNLMEQITVKFKLDGT